MAFGGFSQNWFSAVVDGDTEIGSFQPKFNSELVSARLHLYRQGTEGGSETFTLHLFGGVHSDTSAAFASSSPLVLSEVAAANANWAAEQGWVGCVRFDFPAGVYVDKDTAYRAVISSTNYTRNAEVFYVAFRLHWDQGNPGHNFLAPDIEVIGKI